MNRRGRDQPPAAVNVKKQNSVRRIRTCLRIRLTLLFMIVLPPSDRKDCPLYNTVRPKKRYNEVHAVDWFRPFRFRQETGTRRLQPQS